MKKIYYKEEIASLMKEVLSDESLRIVSTIYTDDNSDTLRVFMIKGMHQLMNGINARMERAESKEEE